MTTARETHAMVLYGPVFLPATLPFKFRPIRATRESVCRASGTQRTGWPAATDFHKVAVGSHRVMRWSATAGLPRHRRRGPAEGVQQPQSATAAAAKTVAPATPNSSWLRSTHASATPSAAHDGGGGCGGSEGDSHRGRGRCDNQPGSQSGFGAHCECLSGVGTCVGTEGLVDR